MMASEAPRISVIMSEFNTPEPFLRQAIESVLRQSFRDFEFIIVNDNSLSRLSTVVRSYNDPRVTVIDNGRNIGFAPSLNRALHGARADLVARMDSDDSVDERHLETLYSFVVAHPEYSVVSTRAMEVNDDGHSMINGRPGEKTKTQVVHGDTPIHPASILRRQDVLDVGGYPEQYVRAEDLALWCELLLAGKRLYVLPDVTHTYRVPHGAKSKRSIRNRRGELAARFHYYRLLHADPSAYVRIVRSILGGVLPWRLVLGLRRLERVVRDRGR